MTLHRLMGRKSLAVFGDLVLGIRLIKVWFIFGGIVPEFRIDRVAKSTS